MNRSPGSCWNAPFLPSSRALTRAAAVAGALLMAGQAGAVTLLTSTSALEAAKREASAAGALVSAAVRADGTPVEVGGPVPRARAEAWRVGLAFEAADDQAPADAGFCARGPGYTVFVGGGGAVLALQAPQRPDAEDSGSGGAGLDRRRRLHEGAPPTLVRLQFDGASDRAEAVLEAPLAGRIHRLVGADPARWRRNMASHGRVRYRDVYPGIDVAFYGNGRELEYDFIVAPGAAADAARLRFDGVKSAEVDADGHLRLDTGRGVLVQRRPVAYQEGPRGRIPVEAAYRWHGDGTIGFELGSRDPRLPLVIDPVLSYATLMGGIGFETCWDVAVDAAGAAYIVGETESPDFSPVRIGSTNAFMRNYQGGLVGVAGDAFVGKLAPNGTSFEWLTYFGGKDLETAFSVTLAPNGEPVIGGFTSSTNFPVSAQAYLKTLPGQTNVYSGRRPLSGFIARLTADGSGLVGSTLFGANGEDLVLEVGLLGDGSVVAVGSTSSTNLPVTPGAPQPAFGGLVDGFVARLSADLSTLLWSTYVGGSARDTVEGVAIDATAGTVHATGITLSTNLPVLAAWQGTNAGGADGFLAGYRAADGGALYATYLGGENTDYAYRAALAASGAVWVAGESLSTNFVGMGGLQATNAGGGDGFAVRVAPNGGTVEYGTFIGGFLEDVLWDVAVDPAGAVHFAGITYSTVFTGIDTNLSLRSTNAGLGDILVAKLLPNGTLSSTFYGGLGDDIAYGVAADAAGNTYLTGRARSVAFPVSSTNVAQASYGGGLGDGFVMKLSEPPVLAVSPSTAGGIALSWAAPNEGFALESAADSGASAAWQAEAVAPVLEAGRHVVRLPAGSSNQVFRLRWAR